jgi:hypothetical protein
MIKVRGPFGSHPAAASWVADLAGQKVPFKEYQTRTNRDGSEAVFAIYEDMDPGLAGIADERIAFDETTGRWHEDHDIPGRATASRAGGPAIEHAFGGGFGSGLREYLFILAIVAIVAVIILIMFAPYIRESLQAAPAR